MSITARRLARIVSSTLFCAVTIQLAARSASAAPPPVDTAREVILQILNLNGDCRRDTVWGRMDSHFQMVPTRIVWGGWDSLHTTPCPGATPPYWPRRKSTTIELPTYTTLSASVSFDFVNQDTARDLVLTYFWKAGDSATGTDTSHSVVCFAQHGLDSTATILAGSIGGFQASPYYAMELRTGVELSEPAVRDAGGRLSYILLPVTLSLPGPPPKTELAGVGTPWQVRVAPNPAHTSTEMTGRMIPQGEYLVEVVGTDGTLERREEVSVAESGDLFTVIDLSDLPSGYHVVVLHSREGASGIGSRGAASRGVGADAAGGTLFGTYPIIITR